MLRLLCLVFVSSITALRGCAGYVETPRHEDFEDVRLNSVQVQLLYKDTEKLIAETEVARTTGFFHVSFEKEAEVILRIVSPSGWVFDKTEEILNIDGSTDPCSTEEDIIFLLEGFIYQGYIKYTPFQLNLFMSRIYNFGKERRNGRNRSSFQKFGRCGNSDRDLIRWNILNWTYSTWGL